MTERRELEPVSSIVIRLLLGVLVIAAIIHTILNRTLQDFSKYSLPLAIAILLAVLGSRAYQILRKPSSISFSAKGLGSAIGFTAGTAIVACFAAVLYYAIGAAVLDVYRYALSPASGRTPAVILTIFVTLSLGGILFVVRLRRRVFYGFTEVLVGATVAGYRVATNQGLNTELYLVVLTAGIYLVVRGLDNVQQGLKARPDDFLSKALAGKQDKEERI